MRYFRCGVVFVIAFMTALSCSAQDPAVDFSYAFATPHRMTVAPPESGDKTLLDCEPGNLRLGWTYENLTTYPLAAFMTPQAVWGVRITPQIDGKPLAKSAWTRAEGFLPVLDNSYTDPEGSVRLEVTGAVPAALVRVTLSNTGAAKHTFRLVCESQRGFLLNHLISEELPASPSGTLSNSDPITGQAAWYDVRVRIYPAQEGEPEQTSPQFAAVPAAPGVQAQLPRWQAWFAGRGERK